MKPQFLLKIYIGYTFCYLAIPFFNIEGLDYFMKPLLLLILLLAVYATDFFPTKKILLIALTFSWLGDIILLFAGNGEQYFIFGLLAFLISHLVYIILFSKQKDKIAPKKNSMYWIGIVLILGYFILMLITLFPILGPLKIPVIVYALVITSMLLMAFHKSRKWETPANNLVVIGALFFVLSDSILAFNKFYTPIEHATLYIMSTYCIAQYLIVCGILKINTPQ
jgi:uncharacterized membrane protein YhhN